MIVADKIIVVISMAVLGLDGIDLALQAHPVFGEPRWIGMILTAAFYANMVGLVWRGRDRA